MVSSPVHSYERFSKQPFCVAVDRALLARAPVAHRVTDLGTGTGTIVEHLFAMGKVDPDSWIVGVDCDADALELARSKLGSNPRVLFVRGEAERVGIGAASQSLVTICNGIHLMDAPSALCEAHRILAPGGVLLLNTAYERTRAFPEGTARSWGMIVSLARRNPLLAAYEPIAHPRQIARYSGEEYCAMAEAAGLRDVQVEYHTVAMDRSALEAICAYEGFAAGVLPGVPVELATRVLVEAVAPALERSRIDAIPRTWMFLAARKGRKSGKSLVSDGGRDV